MTATATRVAELLPAHGAEIARRYVGGESMATLADAFDARAWVIRGVLLARGVALRSRREALALCAARRRAYLRAQGADMEGRYRSRQSMSHIGFVYGCTWQTVRQILLDRGVELRPPGGQRRRTP